MTEAETTKHIWKPETGITDLDNGESLSSSEIPGIRAVWSDQQKRLQGSEQLTEFTQRLSREWAIETGVIENLYDLERGITQTLIERGFQAELLTHGSTDKPREFVLSLLRDQQDALQGVFDFVKDERKLSISYIKELHASLVRSQDTTEALTSDGNVVQVPLIKGDWKKQPNYPIRDRVLYSYCPPEQVASEMDRLVELHEEHVARDMSPEVQSAWFHHRFSQIHPFQDGNGRVARALASLILVKAGLFPLVVTRDDKGKYLDALETADDGDLRALVKFFARLQRVQYTKASAISEAVLAANADLQDIVAGFEDAADRKVAERLREYQAVYNLSDAIEKEIEQRLQTVAKQIEPALKRLDHQNSVFEFRSNQENDFYYRSQIIQNARDKLGYFANTRDYRSWVGLCLNWERRARLIFAFHAIGNPFNGSLICAPFLEFQDTSDGETKSTLVPVAEEGFVFFYNEEKATLLENFRQWADDVIRVAMREVISQL